MSGSRWASPVRVLIKPTCNQCIAEGAEPLDDRRDELAAHALRERVVLVLLVLLFGGSGGAGGGRTAGGAGRRAAGVRDGDVEEEMASDATVTINDKVSTTPARLVAAGAGRPDIVEQVTGTARVADALA